MQTMQRPLPLHSRSKRIMAQSILGAATVSSQASKPAALPPPGQRSGRLPVSRLSVLRHCLRRHRSPQPCRRRLRWLNLLRRRCPQSRRRRLRWLSLLRRPCPQSRRRQLRRLNLLRGRCPQSHRRRRLRWLGLLTLRCPQSRRRRRLNLLTAQCPQFRRRRRLRWLRGLLPVALPLRRQAIHLTPTGGSVDQVAIG